jgi:caa(3)-type oxidase subunit IV
MAERTKQASLQRGVTVIFVLAVLTALEFVIALNAGSLANLLLIPIALVKAFLIVVEFMHIAQLWEPSR